MSLHDEAIELIGTLRTLISEMESIRDHPEPVRWQGFIDFMKERVDDLQNVVDNHAERSEAAQIVRSINGTYTNMGIESTHKNTPFPDGEASRKFEDTFMLFQEARFSEDHL